MIARRFPIKKTNKSGLGEFQFSSRPACAEHSRSEGGARPEKGRQKGIEEISRRNRRAQDKSRSPPSARWEGKVGGDRSGKDQGSNPGRKTRSCWRRTRNSVGRITIRSRTADPRRCSTPIPHKTASPTSDKITNVPSSPGIAATIETPVKATFISNPRGTDRKIYNYRSIRELSHQFPLACAGHPLRPAASIWQLDFHPPTNSTTINGLYVSR
jgi:hypothetical protein